MENENNIELKNLAKYFGADRMLSKGDIEKILAGVFKLLSNFKKDNEQLNADTKKEVDDVVKTLKILQRELEQDIKDGKKEMRIEFSEQVEDLKFLIEEFKKIKPKDGKPGKAGKDADESAIVERVLELIRVENKTEIIEILGENIIDKINSLDHSPENLIDISRIKGWENLNKKSRNGFSPTVISNAMDLDSTKRADGYAIVWDATNNRHKYVENAGGEGGGGSGTVNSGTQYRLAYYATTGTAVSQLSAITASRVLVSDANGLPTHSSVTTTTLAYLDATSSIQTQLDSKISASSTSTLSNKSISLGSNTVTGTLAQFNTALTDADFLSQAGSETVTNKTIDAASNSISNIALSMFASNVIDVDTGLSANSDSRLASQKAIKSYVDNALTGLHWKQAVRVATTTNGTLSTAFANGQTVDGVTLATGDRILIKNQTTATDNGIYIVAASGSPTRATDADTGAELVNATVFVSEGTTNADTQWTCSNNSTPTLGVTNITFVQVAGAGTYSAGTGLSLTGNQFSIDSTVATLSGTQTLTNKTLTSPKIGTSILDTNGATMMALTVVSSAVNYITLANAATTTNPSITATGSDTNIGLDFVTKGTGAFNFRGNSTQPAEIRMYEDTDNGSNYVGFKSPASLSADKVWELPSADGTTDQYLKTNGSGVLSWGTPSGSGGGGSASFIGTRLYKSTGQTIGTTLTAITFDSESFDTDSMHDNATNNSRITITTAGKYRIYGIVSTTTNATARASIKLNGSTYIAETGVGNTGGSITNGTQVLTDYDLVAGDYLELFGAFGASVTCSSGVGGVIFGATLLGGAAGSNKYTYILTPGGASLPATNYPALNKTDGTNLSYHSLDFDQTTSESCFFQVPIPPSCTPTTIKLSLFWTASSGTGAVVWEVKRRSVDDDEVLDATTTPSIITDTVTDTLLATGDVHQTTMTLTTPTDSVADDLLSIKLSRLPADASDTLSGDAKLIRAILEISN